MEGNLGTSEFPGDAPRDGSLSAHVSTAGHRCQWAETTAGATRIFTFTLIQKNYYTHGLFLTQSQQGDKNLVPSYDITRTRS